MAKDYSHCTATLPCWEQHGEHQRGFISANRFNRAQKLVAERAHRLPPEPEEWQIDKLLWAIEYYTSLIAERRRNCVREPFNFGLTQPPKRSQTDAINLEELFGSESGSAQAPGSVET